MELRPSSFTELIELLFADSWRVELGRFRSQFAFRGQSDADHSLTTSLARLGGPVEELELHLLRNFSKYARRYGLPSESIWSRLSLAQHYSLPTRLLDWTYSPFVALHFATCNTELFERDGVVWCLDYRSAHERLPERLREVLAAEGSDVFTVELLDSVARGLAELEALETGEPFLLFLEPPSFDDRIVNQAALFSLPSRVRGELCDWSSDHPQLLRAVVVPAELKWEVRDKLDQANVTERVLFPGLEGLSRWVARYYSPGGATSAS